MSIKSRIATAISLHYLVWLVLFVVVMAIAFFSVGAYLWLVPQIGSAQAAFSVGGGLIGLLVLIGLAAWAVSALRRRNGALHRVGEPHSASEDFIEHQLRPIIGDRAAGWARANPGLLAVGALSVGVLVAASPRARRALLVTARPILIRKGLSLFGNHDG